MALSKERQLYLSVLSLGLAALGVDRLLLDTGPAAANAADLLVKAHVAAPGERGSPVARQDQSFPARLRAKAVDLDPAASDDAFLIPASWLPEAPARPSAELATEVLAPEGRASEMSAKFNVSSLAAAGSRGSAVINGLLLSKGDGFSLRDDKAVRCPVDPPFVLEQIGQDHALIRNSADNSVITVRTRPEELANGRIDTRPRQSTGESPVKGAR